LHVRVRPAADYDVAVSTSDDGIVWLPLQVVDVSVGGLGLLVSEDLNGKRTGDHLLLRITFADQTGFEITATIRHIGQMGHGVCGVQFHEPAEDAMTRIRTAVAELLERGHVA
jgi:hypothetical protein